MTYAHAITEVRKLASVGLFSQMVAAYDRATANLV